jgi:Sulfotransferase domain
MLYRKQTRSTIVICFAISLYTISCNLPGVHQSFEQISQGKAEDNGSFVDAGTATTNRSALSIRFLQRLVQCDSQPDCTLEGDQVLRDRLVALFRHTKQTTQCADMTSCIDMLESALSTHSLHVLGNPHTSLIPHSTRTGRVSSDAGGKNAVPYHGYNSGAGGNSDGTSTSSGRNMKAEYIDESIDDDTALHDMHQKRRFDAQILSHHTSSAIARNRTGPVEYNNLDRLSAKYSILTDILEEYRPIDAWRKTNLPDLHIAGVFKAGSTFLYKLLESHPGTIEFERGKELCLPVKSDVPPDVWHISSTKNMSQEHSVAIRHSVQSIMYNEHKALHEKQMKRKIPMGIKTVNACMRPYIFEPSMWYLQPIPSNKKFFVLFRDPADWLWAGYNYWTFPDIDYGADEGQLEIATPILNYRSPEYFHELIVNGNRSRAGQYLTHLRWRNIDTVRAIRALVNDSNILFLRNEDLLPSVIKQPGGALDRISEFTALDKAGFSDQFTMQISNCNRKTNATTQTCGSERTDAYAMSGNRTMLPLTRRLIYLLFWEECKIWASDYGIEYPACLNVMDDMNDGGRS